MAYTKIYSRINWENEPSTASPINENNLNRMDNAINVLDDRTVELSTNIETLQGYETRVAASATEAANSATSSANSASASNTSATNSANSAQESENQALLSKSYAVGQTGVRTEEDTDNSKYYKEQSAIRATAAYISQINAKASEDASKTSETNAEMSETNAKASEVNAKASENAAKASENAAKVSEISAATSETNAKTYETNAKASEENAHDSSVLSESWAVGGTDTREEEDTNNSKYWQEQSHYWFHQAQLIAESFAGALRPMGTVAFADLPAIAESKDGDMYNVSDEFTTTADFVEGAGISVPLGSNVYLTKNKKWDILAGSPVTGVKGSAETIYRRGNVDITKTNIGLENVDNTSDANKPISTATQSALDTKLALTGDSKDNTTTFTSSDNASIFNSGNLAGQSTYAWSGVSKIATGEKHSSLFNKVSIMFKNIRTIAKLIGTTDISAIGGGTVTGAISQINSDLSDKANFIRILLDGSKDTLENDLKSYWASLPKTMAAVYIANKSSVYHGTMHKYSDTVGSIVFTDTSGARTYLYSVEYGLKEILNNNITYSELVTTSKQVLGAINELKTKLQAIGNRNVFTIASIDSRVTLISYNYCARIGNVVYVQFSFSVSSQVGDGEQTIGGFPVGNWMVYLPMRNSNSAVWNNSVRIMENGRMQNVGVLSAGTYQVAGCYITNQYNPY